MMMKIKSKEDGFFLLLKISIGLMAVILLTTLIAFLFDLIDLEEGYLSGKAYWYFSRSSAFVAYLHLWLSMTFGLLLTTRIASDLGLVKVINNLHQFVSVIGLLFAGFHGIILLGDAFISPGLAQILIPFRFIEYKPGAEYI